MLFLINVAILYTIQPKIDFFGYINHYITKYWDFWLYQSLYNQKQQLW